MANIMTSDGGGSSSIGKYSPSWIKKPDPKNLIDCFIINMRNNKTIYFPTYPSELTEGYSTGYEPFDVRGRSAPYFSYSGNSSRSMSYNVTLHEDLCMNMMATITELKKLVYPEYSGSIVKPPYCYLHFGKMLDCYAVMESIDFTWGETVIENTQYFSKVDVGFSFQELRLRSLPTVNGVFNEGR